MQLVQRLQTLGSLTAVSLLVVLACSLPAFAAEDAKTTTYGGGSVQGYSADSQMQVGTIVQLDDKSKDAKKVIAAKQTELSKMYGVAVDRNKLSFTLSSEGLQNETYVATSGTYDVLVSTQGGTIAPGDYITMSAIDGVGTKADTEQSLVFGRAARGFDGKANSMGTLTLKDTNGKTNMTVALGIVPVAIEIKKNPNEKSTKTNAPEFLQRIGEAIAEKEVSAIRIYLSIAITGISIIAAIAILYSGVRSSLISIGRNPMSKKSIFRALLEIVLTSIIILIIGLFAVYLLLKL